MLLCKCNSFIALITVMVLCAMSQNSLLSVSVRRVIVIFSSAGFKGVRKSCPKACEIAALRRQSESPAQLARFELKPLAHYLRAFDHLVIRTPGRTEVWL